MATSTLTLKLHVAWWLKHYLQGVVFTCTVTGCQPNMERVAHWARKACTVKVAT